MENHPLVRDLLNPETELHKMFSWHDDKLKLTGNGIFHVCLANRRLDPKKLAEFLEKNYDLKFFGARTKANSLSAGYGNTVLYVELLNPSGRHKGDLNFDTRKITGFKEALENLGRIKGFAVGIQFKKHSAPGAFGTVFPKGGSKQGTKSYAKRRKNKSF